MNKEIKIPEGYEARVKDNKVIFVPKKSDDEEIRKWIYGILFNQKKIIENLVNSKDELRKIDKAFAYLERQKENKEYVFRPLPGTPITLAAEQAIRRAKDGEFLVLAFNGVYIPVRKNDDAKELVNTYNSLIENQKEQQSAEWSEEDERMMRYVIGSLDTNISDSNFKNIRIWFESIKDRVHPQPKQEWEQENCKDLSEFECAMLHIGESFFGKNAGLDPNDTALVKEQAKMLIDLVENSPLEWSEEDETAYDDLIWCIEQARKSAKNENDMGNIWFAENLVKNRLKSLRPQSQTVYKTAIESILEMCNSCDIKRQFSAKAMDFWANIKAKCVEALQSPQSLNESHWKPK